MQEVTSTLKGIISPNQIDNVDDEKIDDSLKNSKPILKSSRETMSLNNELDINDYNISNIGSLYECGTSFEPNEHPDMQKVAPTSSQTDSVNKEKKDDSLKKYESSIKLSKETMNIDNDLNINDYNISNIGSRTG